MYTPDSGLDPQKSDSEHFGFRLDQRKPGGVYSGFRIGLAETRLANAPDPGQNSADLVANTPDPGMSSSRSAGRVHEVQQ